MECTVLKVNAFTTHIDLGHPAGVVLAGGDDYTTEQMQQIAAEIGFNETVFVCNSQSADIKLRYFTPGHATPLCGHATIAAVATLYTNEVFKTIKIETLAGILPVTYDRKNHSVQMTQAQPKFLTYNGNIPKLCDVLEINPTDLVVELPICYGNTGSWTLLIPVVDKNILNKMIPHTQKFPSVLVQLPKSSIHPFTLLNRKEATFYARHFSSPFSGTIEDSVTGTAAGVMRAYSLRYIYPNEQEKQLTVFQGEHLGR